MEEEILNLVKGNPDEFKKVLKSFHSKVMTPRFFNLTHDVHCFTKNIGLLFEFKFATKSFIGASPIKLFSDK